MAQFELGVVLEEVMTREGHHERAQERRRTINVVWHLVTVEGRDFDAAAKAAAEWGVARPVYLDEPFSPARRRWAHWPSAR